MNIFDVKKRNILSFDNYFNLKKKEFGGPDSIIKFDKKNSMFSKFQNTVERDTKSFGHQVYNSTYKAMGGDLVHKQDKKKNPYDYPDLYDNMGIATVNQK